MPIIDDRTATLNLAKPHADNLLSDDVARIRSAFDAIDTAVAGRVPSASVTELGGALLGVSSTAAARIAIGLGDVENKSSAAIRGELTSGNVTGALGFTPENAAQKGAAGGYAPLDGAAKIPSVYLPAFVDDVQEAASFAALPGSGETGVIYVTLDNNKSFRWSGSAYVEISASPGSTDAVVEGSTNLYFTTGRVLGVVLAGLSTAASTVVNASHTVLQAIGLLQRQITDRATEIAGKEAAISAGTSAQYWRGDKSWRDLFTDVRLATLTGLSTATNSAVVATNTVLEALGKLQAQVTARISKAGDTMSGAFNEAPVAAVASAGAMNIGAASANTISVTGATTISSLGTIAAGAKRTLVFSGSLVLTHSASLLLPGGASITTAAGDAAEVVSLGGNVWQCVGYTRAGALVLGTPASGNLSNCTADGTSQVGYRNIPQNIQNQNYTLVLADAGKHIYHSDGTGRIYTIPGNATVPFPIGTAVTFVNDAGSAVDVVITPIDGVTLALAADGSSGPWHLTQYGVATAMKVGANRWLISGTGLA